MAGDVIGCCIDLDEGKISYSRLGNSNVKIALQNNIVINNLIISYLLTKSEVFLGKYNILNQDFAGKAENLDFPIKTEHSRLITCLLLYNII